MFQLESSKPTPSQPSSQEEEHFQRGPEWVLASSPQWLIVAMRPEHRARSFFHPIDAPQTPAMLGKFLVGPYRRRQRRPGP